MLKNAKKSNLKRLNSFLSKDDLSIILLYKLKDKLIALEENKKDNIKKFTGNKDNVVEVYNYYQENGIKPIEIIDNKDGTITHIYEDGTKIVLHVTLRSMPFKVKEKRLLKTK